MTLRVLRHLLSVLPRTVIAALLVVVPALASAQQGPIDPAWLRFGITLVVPLGGKPEVDYRNHGALLLRDVEKIASRELLPTEPIDDAVARLFLSPPSWGAAASKPRARPFGRFGP